MTLLKPGPQKIATYDIICWKVFEALKFQDSRVLVSPYMRAKISIPGTFTSEIRHKTFLQTDYIDIAMHSFARLITAKAVASEMSMHGVARCIIPKGTKYHIGSTIPHQEYASEKLIYQKIICFYIRGSINDPLSKFCLHGSKAEEYVKNLIS